MDLTFTEEQEMLRRSVRDLCGKHSTPEIVRALENDPKGYREELWTELAGLDLLGLIIPEEHGGTGATMLDAVIVFEELGRAIAPSPFFVSAVVGAGILRVAGSGEQKAEWLPKVARGEAILSVAWNEPERSEGPEGIQATAESAGEGWRVSGTKHLVAFASSADRLLFLARTPAGVSVFLVDPSGEGVTLTQTQTLASDTSYLVALEGAPAELVGTDGQGWAAFEEAMVDGWIAHTAYALGAAEAAHEMAVEYAKEREQFGRPIGSFQGLAHPLAEMSMELAGAKVLVYQAAWARTEGRPARTVAAMAKLHGCDVTKRTSKVAQQVFGGIGFTLDIDIQLYMRRAKQYEVTWFGPRALEEVVAAAELDAEIPFVTPDAVASSAEGH